MIYFVALAVFGLLLHALATGKASEIGRIVFFCVFLALCLQIMPHLHGLH